MSSGSHRQIFRSSAITGGASAAAIAIGIVKVKLLAVLLGSSGIGIMGVYQNVMALSSTLAGCGIATSAVRQLAASAGDRETLAVVRRTLWLSHLALGAVGMVVLWLVRKHAAISLFGSDERAADVGWLGVGVLLTLVAGSQTALMQGLRRIEDLARTNVVSALFGAAAGTLAIYVGGSPAIIWFVLLGPALGVLVARRFTARLPPAPTLPGRAALAKQLRRMLILGIPFVAGGVLTTATQLVARSFILRELGPDASGHFHAAWAISMTYIGFVLGAMATDYYPRLAGSFADLPRTRQLVAEQTEMGLLLAGPVLLAMVTFAPLVIHLLYTSTFSPSSEILRWQMLGDVLKVAAWPMGFVLLAAGRGGLFLAAECVWSVAYLGAVFLGVQQWGLVASGTGFWFAYCVSFGLLAFAVRRLIGFKGGCRIWLLICGLELGGGGALLLAGQSATAGYAGGAIATLAAGAYSIHRLDRLLGARAALARFFGR